MIHDLFYITTLASFVTFLQASTDCATVLTLFKALGGLTNSTDGCTLPGVISVSGNVTEIDWSFRGLKNSLPTAIGNLKSLKSLELSNNSISGVIPTQLGSISSLENLWLRSNLLSGNIPRQLGNLSNLKKLFLSNNQLTGAIPKELGNLSNLQLLYLQRNKLTFSIPKEIGKLQKLTQLSLSGNSLTGQIPLELGNMTSLDILRLTENQLTGAIPKELSKLVNLDELHLSLNKLSGPVPVELGNLKNLTKLRLFNNSLTAFPEAVLNLPAHKLLLPNPISTLRFDVFSDQATGLLTASNWTNLMTLGSTSSKKRSFTSSMSTSELYATCQLNNLQDADVRAGCIAGVYSTYCRSTAKQLDCFRAYNAVLDNSIFKPLGVCFAWRNGPKSQECGIAIARFYVVLEYITLTRTHAQELTNSILGSPVYAPCSSVGGIVCKY
jgi:Leucine-rich repeat (LRR) protein